MAASMGPKPVAPPEETTTTASNRESLRWLRASETATSSGIDMGRISAEGAGTMQLEGSRVNRLQSRHGLRGSQSAGAVRGARQARDTARAHSRDRYANYA